jgi:2-oxoacid dehydrogenases acyltransferase (catalytic domain)
MSEAKRTIPHFSYVEEVDVAELESLRRHLNDRRAKEAPSLTLLPLVIAALGPVLTLFPQCNVSARCRLWRPHSAPTRACRHRNTNPRRIEGTRGARCTDPHAVRVGRGHKTRDRFSQHARAAGEIVRSIAAPTSCSTFSRACLASSPTVRGAGIT